MGVGGVFRGRGLVLECRLHHTHSHHSFTTVSPVVSASVVATPTSPVFGPTPSVPLSVLVSTETEVSCYGGVTGDSDRERQLSDRRGSLAKPGYDSIKFYYYLIATSVSYLLSLRTSQRRDNILDCE